MKITGELLKTERLNKNLSVQDIALHLKLSSKIVTLIESGSIDELPAKTFVRGFVKGYAQFLKLDTDVVLRQFQEEMGTTNPLPKTPPPMPSAENSSIKGARPNLKHTAQNHSAAKNDLTMGEPSYTDSSKKIVIMLSIAVGMVFVLILSNKIVDNFKADPIASQSVLPVDSGATAIISADASTNSNIINSEIKPNTIEQTAQAQALPASAADTIEEGFEKSNLQPVEVLLEAKKDIELHYAKGNSKQFVLLKLSANQIQILRSKVGLYLKTSDASAVKISVNGLDMATSNTIGKPLKMTF